eukprot:scaffold21988_cov76-Skeletonema_marinoi.AAC.2
MRSLATFLTEDERLRLWLQLHAERTSPLILYHSYQMVDDVHEAPCPCPCVVVETLQSFHEEKNQSQSQIEIEDLVDDYPCHMKTPALALALVFVFVLVVQDKEPMYARRPHHTQKDT